MQNMHTDSKIKRQTRDFKTTKPRRLDFDVSPSKKSRVVTEIGQERESEIVTVVSSALLTSSSTNESQYETKNMPIVTPSKLPKCGDEQRGKDLTPKARRRLSFGKLEAIFIPENVRLTYKLIRKVTGSIGGNGSFGAIYGELTIGSMQKMINLMKTHTTFGSSSRFIDVGSGIGKPNLHVIQDPGVEFSYGIEMERSRWLLGLASLKAILTESSTSNNTMGYKCMFDHGNIKAARTFDPFTHVYMFSIGHLSAMFNASRSPYLICYHPPKVIREKYGFDVDLIAQTPTSMHGSSEGHSGYLYKRCDRNRPSDGPILCDEAYLKAYDLVKSGFKNLNEFVVMKIDAELSGGRVTRTKNTIHCVESDDE